MDVFGTGISVIMACLLLAVFVETICFVLCRNAAKVPRHSHDSSSSCKHRNLHQKLPGFQKLCRVWKNRNAKARKKDEDEDSTIPAASSSSQVVLTLHPYCVEAPGYGDIWQIEGLVGPPRLLFTINEEETEQDLECEDGKSRNGKSRRESQAPSNDFSSAQSLEIIIPSASPENLSPPELEHLSPRPKPVSFYIREPPSPDNLSPHSKPLSLQPASPPKPVSFYIQEPPSPPRSRPLSFYIQEPPSQHSKPHPHNDIQETTAPFSKPLSFYIEESDSPRNPANSATRSLGSLFQQVPPNASPGPVNHLNRVYPVGSPSRREKISMQKQFEGLPILGGGRKLQSEPFPRGYWPPSPQPSSGNSSPYRASSPRHPSIGEEEIYMPFIDIQQGTSS